MAYNGNPPRYYLLTAGHCGGRQSAWYQAPDALEQPRVPIGRAALHGLWQRPKTDSMAIEIPARASAVTNEITLAPRTYRPILSSSPQGGDKVRGVLVPGETVCHAGINVTIRCGPLDFGKGQDCSVYSNGLPGCLHHLRGANFPLAKGDSGGPVFYGNDARGLAQAYWDTEYPTKTVRFGVYTDIYDVVTRSLRLDGLLTRSASP